MLQTIFNQFRFTDNSFLRFARLLAALLRSKGTWEVNSDLCFESRAVFSLLTRSQILDIIACTREEGTVMSKESVNASLCEGVIGHFSTALGV